MTKTYADFAAFWPYYLTQHADPRTRAVHYCGTVLGCLLVLCCAAGGGFWTLIAAPVAGYGPAWAAHALIERNRPATFTYPIWSFAADFRMLYCAATGRLGAELTRAGLA
ncbi:MAG TPA: DUF962 domain-containing protein [Stellaceae bacterium]|nr:DUF962 domain-containing protein [Stellaceae bacterium]